MFYFLNDHLGTPQKIVNASGNLVWQAVYQPFWEAQLRMAVVSCNLRFPGQYFDSESGLHYNWHRYYDPETGRYITADPIGLSGGINLYSYVLNNPMTWVDPSGLIWHFNSLRDRIDALLAQGEIAEALVLAEAEGATSLVDRVRKLQSTLSSLLNKYPPSSFRCDTLATKILDAFKAVGADPKLIKITDKFRAQIFTTSDGVRFAESGFHQAVQVGNRVFDALTGPEGMLISDYISTLESYGIYVVIK